MDKFKIEYVRPRETNMWFNKFNNKFIKEIGRRSGSFKVRPPRK
jgi:hypothetical protein